MTLHSIVVINLNDNLNYDFIRVWTRYKATTEDICFWNPYFV